MGVGGGCRAALFPLKPSVGLILGCRRVFVVQPNMSLTVRKTWTEFMGGE